MGADISQALRSYGVEYRELSRSDDPKMKEKLARCRVVAIV